jgi:hypothetical protein
MTTLHKPQGILAAILLLAAGCQNQGAIDEPFPAETEGSLRQTMQLQASAGAREDAMLYDAHFDANQLNSLGASKLALMLGDSERAFPVSVWICCPGDAKDRRHAVETYLQDVGLKAAQYRVEIGPNPKAVSPSAKALTAIPKTDTGASGAAQSTSGAPAPEVQTKLVN